MVAFSGLPAELRVHTWSFISPEELPLMQSVSKVWNDEIGGTKSLYTVVNNVTAVQLRHLLPRSFPRQVAVTIDCVYEDDYSPFCTILRQHLSRISYLWLTFDRRAWRSAENVDDEPILYLLGGAAPCLRYCRIASGLEMTDVSGQTFAGNAPIERLHLDGIQILEPQQAFSKVEYFSGTACWREAPREMPQVMTPVITFKAIQSFVARLFDDTGCAQCLPVGLHVSGAQMKVEYYEQILGPGMFAVVKREAEPLIFDD